MSDETENHADLFESILTRIRNLVVQELESLEANLEDGAKDKKPEERTRALTGFLKIVQGLDTMINEVQEKRDAKTSRGVDVVEFRRKLEKQIAQLVHGTVEKKLP